MYFDIIWHGSGEKLFIDNKLISDLSGLFTGVNGFTWHDVSWVLFFPDKDELSLWSKLSNGERVNEDAEKWLGKGTVISVSLVYLITYFAKSFLCLFILW